jgi:lipopolysaccharide export system protein LptA
MSRRRGLTVPTLRAALVAALFIAPTLIMPPTPAQAQQGLRFAIDADAPIAVRAAQLRWQRAQGIAELKGALKGDVKGEAQVSQGPMQLSARNLHIRFAPNGGTAQTLTARTNVVLVNQDGQRATADKADFDIENQRLILHGNVKVKSRTEKGETQNLSGARLHINMVTGQADLRGGKTRARIELTPTP